MRRRTLPKVGIDLSEVSFGTGRAAGVMVNGTHAEQIATVEAALEEGINHFDTAPLYGFGASETNLGRVLQEVEADVFVTTKFNLLPQFLDAPGGIATGLRNSVRESLGRLRRSHIDMLLVHNATRFVRNDPLAEHMPLHDVLPHLNLDDLLGRGGVWEVLEEFKKDGTIRAWGLSGQDNDPRAMCAVMATGAVDIVNQPFNLMNPSAGFDSARDGRPVPEWLVDVQPEYVAYDGTMDVATRFDVGISVISPLAAGVLTEEARTGQDAPLVSERARRFPHEGQYGREVKAASSYHAVAERFGLLLNELALRFTLSAPGVTTAVTGFSTPEQVRQACDAARKGGLPDEVLAGLREVWYGGGAAAIA